MSRLPGVRLRAILLSIALFCLNAYICRELFTAGFLNNLSSNEGAFVSIARFFQEHPTDWRWFPWFNAGTPIENAYQPLLPVVTALLSSVSGWHIERAFHFVLAMALCLGPVTLFWFVYDWSKSLAAGAGAALVYSLSSPAQWFIPILRLHLPNSQGSLRLFNLIHYAEDPHIVALTFLPLALLFLRRGNLFAAVIASSAVVLTNAFGAMDLAIGGICIVLASHRGLRALPITGVLAWLWISPWLTPSLIRQMSTDQWGARGFFHAGPGLWLAVILFVAIWYFSRRLPSSFARFTVLFVPLICAIPVGFFVFDLTLVPQGNRYQLELEMAVAIAIGCLFAHIRTRSFVAAMLIVAGTAAGIWQTAASRRFARALIQPVDITQTIQYKTTEWLRENLPGQRTMISGDVEFLNNVISDNPQMSGGHEPTASNLVERFAIFAIYTGLNAGDRDAEYSLIWLRAYGSQAITVPGEKSREAYHPFVHPHKFEGLLPVLWRREDDTIFAIPQPSPSLAHVVPRDAIVAREPAHGVDVEPVRPYVAALGDDTLPLAKITWNGPSHAHISAALNPGQVLSIQESYAPGWRASVRRKEIPVRRDGLGLIVLEPDCAGPCELDLWYGVSTEAWICRAMSLSATFLLIGLPLKRYLKFPGRIRKRSVPELA